MTRRGGWGVGVKGFFGLVGVVAAMWLAVSPPPAHAQRAFVRIASSGSTTGFYFVAAGLAKVIGSGRAFKEPLENLRAVVAGHTNTQQIMVLEKSPFKCV